MADGSWPLILAVALLVAGSIAEAVTSALIRARRHEEPSPR